MNSRRSFFRLAAAAAALQATASDAAAYAEVQVPKMKFFGVEISRLVAGCNQFYGFSHYNEILSTVMREYYTPDRVCEVLRRCNRFGINAFNYVHLSRGPQDLAQYQAEGGHMHLIAQDLGDPAQLVKLVKPLAIYRQGEITDRAFNTGTLATVREWCKKARDTGVVVGVGTHRPEVIATIEEQGWDVDFYAGCVYDRTRTAEEWKRVLNGSTLEMQGEAFLRGDPPKMYAVMRQTKKPCFAFKIMAAGRITGQGAGKAFQTAFESIKPTDGVFIGLFPRIKDEVRENAEHVYRLLSRQAKLPS